MRLVTLAMHAIDPAAPPGPSLPDSPWPTIDVARLDSTDESHEPRWVLPGLLEEQSRLLLAGDEGAGKSLLLMQFAVRLAAGLPALPGDGAPRPLRVMVFDTELNARTARRRLAPMAAHAGLRPGQLLYVLAPAGIDLLRDDERGAFTALVAGYRPHLLGIDSLYRAFNADPDDPRVGGEVQRVLDTVRADVGCSLLIACHYRKRSNDGRYRRSLDDLAGSRVWKAWPESAVDVTDKTLRVLKDREGTARELTLHRAAAGQWEHDPDGWPFTITSSDDGPTEPTWRGHTLIQPWVLEALSRSNDALSGVRVHTLVADDRTAAAQKPFHRSNVTAALGELLELGHVAREPGPRGAHHWRITDRGITHLIDTSKDTPQ